MDSAFVMPLVLYGLALAPAECRAVPVLDVWLENLLHACVQWAFSCEELQVYP